jgi:hypothetical protein
VALNIQSLRLVTEPANERGSALRVFGFVGLLPTLVTTAEDG